MSNELQAVIPPASQALLHSQAGPFASRAFTTIPYTTEFEYPSHLFRILLLRRLRLHLPLCARCCRCRRPVNLPATTAQHVLSQQSYEPEEALWKGQQHGFAGKEELESPQIHGPRITIHHTLSRVDDRRIEVIGNGLPMWGGNQLAVDTTLVSPLTRSGQPRSRGGTFAGAALQDARRTKERTYPELLRNRRCRLVVLGIEARGRWSNEASSFIGMLAQARARSSPPSFCAATACAVVSLWSALLTHAAASSFAASLLFEDFSAHHNQPGLNSPTPRPTPLRHQPGCADQSPPSPAEEGLALHLPYQKHIWRVASIKTVCAWRLPMKKQPSQNSSPPRKKK